MTWNEVYPKTTQPDLEQIGAFVNNPVWEQIRSWLEQTYASVPRVAHSTCSGAPGWNVKYGKGGRALCTLYPRKGYFISLVTIGAAEAAEAEWLIPFCSEPIRELYRRVAPMNGARWLMIEVATPAALEDVKRLIGLRVKPRPSVANERGAGRQTAPRTGLK